MKTNYYFEFFGLLVFYFCSKFAESVSPKVSYNITNVRQGVADFLGKCKGSTGVDKTVKDATLCVENGFAQVSGRNLRSLEGIADACRAILSVLHCLPPKEDLEKCAGKQEVATLDLLSDFCENSGAKIAEFSPIFACLRRQKVSFTTCSENKGFMQFTQNIRNGLGAPCDALSILEKCTEDTLNECKNPEDVFGKFLTELEVSSRDAYQCISRLSQRNTAAGFSSIGVLLGVVTFVSVFNSLSSDFIELVRNLHHPAPLHYA